MTAIAGWPALIEAILKDTFMKLGRHLCIVSVLLAAIFLPIVSAHAQTLQVACPRALAVPVQRIAAQFAARTGMDVVIKAETAGYDEERAHGRRFDVAIMTASQFSTLARHHRVMSETRADLARIGVGIAVPAGRALPDLANIDALRRTLLEAHVVVIADPSAGTLSGAYAVKLFDRLGIAHQMKSRSVLVPAKWIAGQLETGKADLALQEETELQGIPGIRFAGSLPEAVQYYTTYVGAVTTRSSRTIEARALLSFIAA